MKALSTAVLTLTLVACNSDSVGYTNYNTNNNNTNQNNNNTNQNNNNTNQNNNNTNNNNVQEEFLTRRVLVQQTVNEVMGFDLDFGPNCPAANYYEDVGVEGFDEYLCWAIHFAVELNVEPGSEMEGFFVPERRVTYREMWRLVTELIGFYPFHDADCDVMVDPNFGTLCQKGLLNYAPQTGDEFVLLQDWYTVLASLKGFMNISANRRHTLEIMLMTLEDFVPYNLNCTSEYFDVDNGSFDCQITSHLLDLGILDPSQVYFRPLDPVVWSELMKFVSNFMNVSEAPLGCTDICDGLHWACGWVNAFCELGLLPEGLTDINTAPTLGQAAEFIYKAKIHILD